MIVPQACRLCRDSCAASQSACQGSCQSQRSAHQRKQVYLQFEFHKVSRRWSSCKPIQHSEEEPWTYRLRDLSGARATGLCSLKAA